LEEADPAPIAAKTRRPTLVLTTSNDPIISIVGSSDLERAATQNPYLHVTRTPEGGHIGQIGLWPEWFASTLSTFFRYSPAIP
jgi:predicted alpha/beta-fold hydrolase